MAASRLFTFGYRRPPNAEERFDSLLVSCDARKMVLSHALKPKSPLIVNGKPALIHGDIAVWFLFKGEPYDVARIYSPRGVFRGYYVDALEPVSWEGSNPWSLEPLVDLFLDLWIWPELRYEILDAEELAGARDSNKISPDQFTRATDTIARLAGSLARGQFPPPGVVEFDVMASPAITLFSGSWGS